MIRGFIAIALGEFLYRFITPDTTGSYDFMIKDDIITVWLFRSDNKYLYSLSGDLISTEKYEYSELPIYKTSFDERKAWKNDKLINRYHSLFGFWWVTNETDQCVVHIPVLMYALKICLLLEFIFCWLLTYHLYNYITSIRGRFPGQSGDGSLIDGT